MGASHEMGRNESCVRKPTLPAVVQSIHWPPPATPVAVDPQSPQRVWIFCVRPEHTEAGSETLDHLSKARLFYLPCSAGPDEPLIPELIFCVWVTERLAALVGPKRINKPPLKVCTLTQTCWCRPVVCKRMLRIWNIVFNISSIWFVCVQVKHAVCNSSESFYPPWDHQRCCLNPIYAPPVHNLSSLFSLLRTGHLRLVFQFFEISNISFIIAGTMCASKWENAWNCSVGPGQEKHIQGHALLKWHLRTSLDTEHSGHQK